jgi:pyruvate/2-oxoglutarate dehydrogenase complex dihydrolipoamide dehydrogenase (E3) component
MTDRYGLVILGSGSTAFAAAITANELGMGVAGLIDEEANAAGRTCWCNTVLMEVVPRAGAIRDTRGVIKMVADADTHEVLGVSMLGVNVGEVIHEAAMGLRFHATIDDFIDLLHVYPTMAEALKIVAISRYWEKIRAHSRAARSRRTGPWAGTGHDHPYHLSSITHSDTGAARRRAGQEEIHHDHDR